MPTDSEQSVKRGRGRPRKTPEQSKRKIKQNNVNNVNSENTKNSKSNSKKSNRTFSKSNRDSEPEQKLLLYLQGSTDTDEDSDNGFTETDAPPKTERIRSLTDHREEMELDNSDDSDTESENEDLEEIDDDVMTVTPIDYSHFNTKDHDVLILLKHIRKRDAVISRLMQDTDISRRKNPKNGRINPLHAIKGLSRTNNIEYHCTLADAESEKIFTPCPNDLDCWWCDYGFDHTPVYLPQMYRDQTFYVFGNFCSYNCALRYNHEMKDSKVRARTALLLNMKDKNLGTDIKIKPADRREILESKGGPHTIEQFRQGFNLYEESADMDMPPMIPLVHVIKYT